MINNIIKSSKNFINVGNILFSIIFITSCSLIDEVFDQKDCTETIHDRVSTINQQLISSCENKDSFPIIINEKRPKISSIAKRTELFKTMIIDYENAKYLHHKK